MYASNLRKKTHGRLEIGIQRAIRRVAAVTKTSTKIVSQLKLRSDVDNWHNRVKETRQRPGQVPLIFKQVIRLLIRDLIVQDKKLPTLQLMQSRLCAGLFSTRLNRVR